MIMLGTSYQVLGNAFNEFSPEYAERINIAEVAC